jgi:hypothetical protein
MDYPIQRIDHLDALRVMFEFTIVSVHVVQPTERNRLYTTMAAADFMSFFFVLSGFVMMYRYKDDKHFTDWTQIKQYWCKRWTSNYPLYFLVCLVNYIHLYAIKTWQQKFVESKVQPDQYTFTHVCIALEFTTLGNWVNCGSAKVNVSDVGWYMSVMLGYWTLFPLLRSTIVRCFQDHPWPKIIGLSLGTNILYILLNIVPSTPLLDGMRATPIRIWEILMGAGLVFTLEHRVPSVLVGILAAMFIVYYIIADTYLQYIPWWCDYGTTDINQNPDKRCIPIKFTYMWGKTSILWALLIQWVACTQIHAIPTNILIPILRYNFLQDINYFSLQLYLCHSTIWKILIGVVTIMHMDWFNMPIYFILVYYICFLIRQYPYPHITTQAEHWWSYLPGMTPTQLV